MHIGLILVQYLHFGLAMWNSTRDPITMDNFVPAISVLSICIGVPTFGVRFVDNWRNREKITTLLRTINGRVQESRKVASDQLQGELLGQYKLAIVAILTAIFLGVFFVVSMVILYLITGNLYFVLIPPEVFSGIGIGYWLQMVCSSVVVMYCMTFYALFDGMWLDCVLQLTFLYRVQYERLTNLSGCDSSVKSQLIAVFKELEALKR